MHNSVLVGVMHGTRNFAISSTAWRIDIASPDYFVELAAFDEFHAEVALTVALAHFVNRDNAWMI